MIRRNVDLVALTVIVLVHGFLHGAAFVAGHASRLESRFEAHTTRLEHRTSQVGQRVGVLGEKLEAAGESVSKRVGERVQRLEKELEGRFE
jgi:hypothetical protein